MMFAGATSHCWGTCLKVHFHIQRQSKYDFCRQLRCVLSGYTFAFPLLHVTEQPLFVGRQMHLSCDSTHPRSVHNPLPLLVSLTSTCHHNSLLSKDINLGPTNEFWSKTECGTEFTKCYLWVNTSWKANMSHPPGIVKPQFQLKRELTASRSNYEKKWLKSILK